ncbi:MAG: SMP-30/gluconolactonase/LRE family protein [Bacteroidota bacterium]
MRLAKRIALFLLISILTFAIYTFSSTGFFRTVHPAFNGKIRQTISLKGTEDLTISLQDSFAILSATDRKGYPVTEENGHLYWMDLRKESLQPLILSRKMKSPFGPHGISLLPKDSSYQIMAVNHTPTGHSLEVFELKDQLLQHIQTLTHPSIVHPNDVVLVDSQRFYFTNDHAYTEGIGRLIEDYGGLAISNVVYFDGQTYREVAKGIAYANGINIDRKRNLLYVASPRHFLVKVYDIENDGSLTFVEDIPCGTGVDNIELDTAGNLWIGAHPDLLRFNAYAKGKRETAPSEVIKIIYRGKEDYSVESIYTEDGTHLSASTVAAPFGNMILVGSVKDDEVLVLEQAQ